ncbi:MAG: phosphotransferase family protein [Halolamina sp.]
MSDDPGAMLERHTEDYQVVRELHRIRPHATYEVRFRGERAVCKLATHPLGDPELEAHILQYVGAETSVPVPEVLAVGDDHFVARWCDGLPNEAPERDEERIRALGRGLATLHEETAADFDRTGFLRVGDDGTLAVDADRRWSDTLLALLKRREQFLDTVGYGHLAREAADWLRANHERFNSVDDAVLVHGNYFGEHVAVEDSETSAVIDFEHALAASPEWGYLRTALPVFGANATHDVPERVFREAYESVRPLPAGFDQRRDAYVALNAVSYLRSLHLQRGDIDDRQAVARRARLFAERLGDRLQGLETAES